MDYAEHEPPEPLRPFVNRAWTLTGTGSADQWLTQSATPDGCVEIIRRLSGRSRWDGEQPDAFVAGPVTHPTAFEISGDARFVALRIWPWAWNAIAAVPAPQLIDRWLPLDSAAPGLSVPEKADELFAAFRPNAAPGLPDLALAILSATSVGDLVLRSGRPHRWLQRWFESEIGMPPRAYLRLLRFQETLADLQRHSGSLADQAAAHGYADQAHMAREFKRLTGLPARRARARALGPFV